MSPLNILQINTFVHIKVHIKVENSGPMIDEYSLETVEKSLKRLKDDNIRFVCIGRCKQ